MPWKACKPMDERLKFIARVLDGEKMAPLCREFSISRKTGYKILRRYNDSGLQALTDRSRRPVRYANQLPNQVESLIVSLKRNKPHWGARKIRELLLRRLPGDLRLPAKSTIHAVLDRHGLVKRRGKRRSRATGTPLSKALAPNDLWCADFKGEFKLGNGRYCYPLTVTTKPPASCSCAKPSKPSARRSPLPLSSVLWQGEARAVVNGIADGNESRSLLTGAE
jgi:transposase